MELDIIDIDGLVEYVGGNKDAAMSLLKEFHKDLSGSVPEVVDEIQAAASEGDTQKVREKAHYIKGMAANLTARRLSEAAHQVETAAKNNNHDNFYSLIKNISKEVKALKEHLQESLY